MPDKDSKCVCCSCRESLPLTKFYKSNSEFYPEEHLPICKDCFANKFGFYTAEYQSTKKAMQRMCMAFDVYFNEDLFDSCDTDSSTVLGKYFRKLNIKPHKGKTFDSSLEEGFELSGNRKVEKNTRVAVIDEYGNEDNDTEINPKDIEKWGVGFEPVDYDILNTHYESLCNSNPHSESNAEIFIVDLCYTKMQQMKAVREGNVDNYNKLTELYRKTFTQAGLKTVKDANAIEDFTIGVNAETIEKYTPAEYYKNKSLYKDHDNIGEYVERFLLRPLKNLMHGTKDRDFEFYVKDEEETDGYSDEE